MLKIRPYIHKFPLQSYRHLKILPNLNVQNQPKFRKKYVKAPAPKPQEPKDTTGYKITQDRTIFNEDHAQLPTTDKHGKPVQFKSDADEFRHSFKEHTQYGDGGKKFTWTVKLILDYRIAEIKAKRAFKQFTRNIRPDVLVNKCPEHWRPLMRLSRMHSSIGTWLLFYPCAFSIMLSGAPIVQQLPTMGIFLWGSFCMRGAGCIINDLLDKDFDKKIARTRTRPLAAGTVTSKQAKTSLVAHVAGAAATLPFLPPSCTAIALGAIPMVAVYPLAKRFTNVPQFVLGSAFSIGSFMGYAAMNQGFVDPYLTVPLFMSSVFWVLYYDTIYAFQDMEDDSALGVKSLALSLAQLDSPKKMMDLTSSNRSKAIIASNRSTRNALQSLIICHAGLLSWSLHLAGCPPQVTGLYIAAAIWKMYKHSYHFNMNDPARCWTLFQSERYYGLLVMLILGPGWYYSQKLEEMHEHNLKSSSNGYVEMKAEEHHIMAVDKEIRLHNQNAFRKQFWGDNSSDMSTALYKTVI